MDIDEIKCQLCQQVYDEESHIPILLPDCGHSFCLSCIHDYFELLQENEQTHTHHQIQEPGMEEIKQDNNSNDKSKDLKQVTFRCPEDEVECSIQNPDQLPKNYALLKIVKKTKEIELLKNKKLVKLEFNTDEQKFHTKGDDQEEACLTKYLQRSQTTIKDQIDNQKLESQINKGIVQPKVNVSSNNLTAYQSLAPINTFTNGLELCPQHKRPMELICVDDKQRICTQCALFGNHKGHDVRQEEEVTREISLKVEVLMEMFQAMEEQCDDLSNPENYDKQFNIYKTKQNELKSKIQEQFKEWRKALRAVEMQVIDSLYSNFTSIEDKFQQAYKMNKMMIAEVQQWMDRAKLQLDDYSVKTQQNQHYIPFDMIDGKQQSIADEILNQGEQVLEKTEKFRGFPSLNGMDHYYGQIKLQFDPNFEKKLINIAKVVQTTNHTDSSADITNASQSFLPPFSFNDEEENNENFSQPVNTESGLNLSNISFNEISSPTNESRYVSNKNIIEKRQLVEKQDETILSNTSSADLQVSSQSVNQCEISTRESISKIKRMSNLKPLEVKNLNIKKKNDLATSFKEETISGILDLSNRSKQIQLILISLLDLSDMHVNELAKCIKSNSGPVKSLNLSKNRISDEGINHIIKALCDSQIEFVNIQNNKLSEKCVETMVGILKTNKNLKVLDLQNNGIQSRLMKNKLKNSLTQMEVII